MDEFVPRPMDEPEGGESACWLHLFDDERRDLLDRGDIERLVVAFYRDAAMDDLLGPVFHAARVDWGAHVATLVNIRVNFQAIP